MIRHDVGDSPSQDFRVRANCCASEICERSARTAILRAQRTHPIAIDLEVVNVIKVALKDDIATLFINGEQVEQLRGQLPQDGGTVGLFARAPTGAQPPWRFVKISVVTDTK